jgi:glycosyltransferase involved in cell wall biosynthesis
MTSPVLSVAVFAHNEAGSIERMLASVARQSLWRLTPRDRRQVVVYANGCADETAAIARRFAASMTGLEVVETPARGKSQAWNAVRSHLRADADWWVFADADVIVHWRALEHLFAEAMAHPEAAVVSSTLVSSARYLPPGARGFLIAARVEAERLKPQRREVSARLYAMRCDVARSITLPPGLLNEDLVLTRLLGSERIRRSRRALVFNREPASVRDLVRYQVRTRIGSFQARRLPAMAVDSNKTPAAVRQRTKAYRGLSWRAWIGKALWLPLRLYVEWAARRVPPASLGDTFWMEVSSAKLVPSRRERR